MFNFIFKVLFLAVTMAFLGVWGIFREQRKSQDLSNKIYSKCKIR